MLYLPRQWQLWQWKCGDRDSDSGWLRFNLWICFKIAQNYKACEYIILRFADFCLYVCGSDSDSYSNNDSDSDRHTDSDSDSDRDRDSDSDRDGDSVSPCYPLQFAFIMVKLVSTLI